ncbi:helix-turn-helix domain-containing protein [Pseudokineococcus sp. 5B2Z-1]|uniref:helix-turn-helix domain-containing protein n=1 Tax=Pseudokineococcus sp. 5B2Z-1 TaxID=3132744 RepID=UPI0030AA0DDB
MLSRRGGECVLTTDQAASYLDVSSAEIRRLVRNGALTATSAGRTILVDEASVRRRARLAAGRGRPLDPSVAWAALWMASGERPDWVDQRTRTRLRSWLRQRTPESVATACRRRADVHDVRVLPAYREAVLSHDGVAASGLTAASDVGADVVAWGEHVAVAYCSRGVLDELTDRYGINGRGVPNLSLRVPRAEAAAIVARRTMPAAVVAVDLLEDDDVRTRRAGADLLDRCLRENLG